MHRAEAAAAAQAQAADGEEGQAVGTPTIEMGGKDIETELTRPARRARGRGSFSSKSGPTGSLLHMHTPPAAGSATTGATHRRRRSWMNPRRALKSRNRSESPRPLRPPVCSDSALGPATAATTASFSSSSSQPAARARSRGPALRDLPSGSTSTSSGGGKYTPISPPTKGGWPLEGVEYGKSWGQNSTYQGERLAGDRHGFGTELWQNGIEYRGSWRHGLRDGLGVWHDPNTETRFEGQWRRGVKDGWGVYKDPTKQYEGYWSNDNINGKGSCAWAERRGEARLRYEGAWRDGKEHGRGVLEWRDGRRYEGNFAKGQQTGHGVFRFSDGTTLETDWEHGLPLPGGVFTSAQGQVLDAVDYHTVVCSSAVWTTAVQRLVSHLFARQHAEQLQPRRLALGLDAAAAASTGAPPPSPGSPASSAASASPRSPRQAAARVEGIPVPIRRGEWRALQQLGTGCFGSVFKCLHLGTGAFFAAKQVAVNDPLFREDQRRALVKEVRILQSLQHPNVVAYLGCNLDHEADTTLSLFVELVGGGDIASLLARNHEPLPGAVVASYTRQMVAGLAYLHSRQIVHRDIKGANVLVSLGGVCKLADFGVSALLELVGTISLRGTPYFLAPEILRGEAAKAMLPASDVWSLGCTVFQMATALPPWKQQFEAHAFFFMVGSLKEDTELPLDLPDESSFSAAGRDFILQTMRPDARQRPSAAQLALHPFLSTAKESQV